MTPEEIKPVNIPPKMFKHKLLSWILGALGLLVVLAIIGLGALLASHTWNPSWNPFKQPSNSDKIIREKFLKQIKK